MQIPAFYEVKSIPRPKTSLAHMKYNSYSQFRYGEVLHTTNKKSSPDLPKTDEKIPAL